MRCTYQTYNLWFNMTHSTDVGTVSTRRIKFTIDAVGAKFITANIAWTNF